MLKVGSMTLFLYFSTTLEWIVDTEIGNHV